MSGRIINIGFVCQPGRLEAQSCLLAASIDRHLGDRVRMIAATAEDPTGLALLSSRTTDFLDRHGVEIRPIVNPVSSQYPIGNKLACLKLLEDLNQTSLFLDTDMLVLEDFLSVFNEPFEFMAKPADLPTSGLNDEEWVELLTRHGVNVPTARFMTTHDMKAGMPYFNAGFIGLSEGSKISDTWIRHAIQIARLTGRHQYHLDQIALTIAVYDSALEIRPLSEYMNFPAHLRDVPEDEPVRIIHYHHPDRIAGNIRARNNISELCEHYVGLREILDSDVEWGWVAALRPAKKPSNFVSRNDHPSPNFIITGTPRSGTSLFSAAIATLPDTIVINEPGEIFEALTRSGGYGLSTYYQNLRASILVGNEVENKVDDTGKLFEDTASQDTRRKVIYAVGKADFALGTKNTLAYLSRLEQISETMPGSRIFCCIRNPISTIASWVRSFDHLRKATPGQSRIGTLIDPFIPEFERDLLRQLDNQSDYAIKRALWWNFLARRILRNLDRVTLIKYEDYVSDPESHIHQARLALGLKEEDIKAAAGQARKLEVVDRSNELSSWEIQCIRGICATLAARFGYEI